MKTYFNCHLPARKLIQTPIRFHFGCSWLQIQHQLLHYFLSVGDGNKQHVPGSGNRGLAGKCESSNKSCVQPKPFGGGTEAATASFYLKYNNSGHHCSLSCVYSLVCGNSKRTSNDLRLNLLLDTEVFIDSFNTAITYRDSFSFRQMTGAVYVHRPV